jgi:hypothetical protein
VLAVKGGHANVVEHLLGVGADKDALDKVRYIAVKPWSAWLMGA